MGDTRFEFAGAALAVSTFLPNPSFDKEGACGHAFESHRLTPKKKARSCNRFGLPVEDTRFELVTSCMPRKRSNQLS